MNYNPSQEEINFVNHALEEFNNTAVGPDNHELLNIVEYDSKGNVIAGILGGTYWGWMHLDILWVDEKYRKSGIGSRLLKAAEEEAVRKALGFQNNSSSKIQYLILSQSGSMPRASKSESGLKSG